MSSKYWIFAFLFFIIIPFYKEESKEDVAVINELSYRYTSGYEINSDVSYDIICDKKCRVSIKPYGKSKEEAITKTLSTSQVDELRSILVKYNIVSWDGFKKTDKDVLDGDSFSFYLKYNNDETVSASGYMMWPSHYRDFQKEFEGLFNENYNKER